MSQLEVKVPPPLIWLGSALVMWAVARFTPAFTHPLAARGGVGVAFVVLGAALAVSGVRAFHRAGTTTNPTAPGTASVVVSTGPFRVTRNPMYLGLLLSLVGWAFYLSNILAVLMLPVFVGYMTRFQILPEERALRQKFGEAYAQYAARVRRWL